MVVKHDVSMLPYNTFGLDAKARNYVEVDGESTLRELISSGLLGENRFLVLGGGSNIVFRGDYDGTVVRMTSQGIEKVGELADGTVLVRAQAGTVWDYFVDTCIANGWYGVENLTAIPGTVGASAVQNVGAYGAEAKDVIEEVRAFDVATGEERVFANEECHFAYRNSAFKQELAGRYIIESVTFRLNGTFALNKQYKAVAAAVAESGIENPTAREVADIITAVRWKKLPRPEEKGSAGSFFKNPVVTASQYEQLMEQYPDLVAFAVDDEHFKLAAGWMIEHCGWKGRSLGRAGVYEKQALVLVNLGGCTGREVENLSNAITADVEDRFGVKLTPEAIMV